MPPLVCIALLLSYVAFAWTTGHPLASLLLLGAALAATAMRGRISVPRQVLLPVALVLGILIITNLPDAPAASTLLLGTGYGVGLALGTLTLLFLVRSGTAGEQLTGVFLGMMLMLVAGSTTELHPYAELLAAQGLLLSLGLRNLALPGSREVSESLQRPVAPGSASRRPLIWTTCAYVASVIFCVALASVLYRSERLFNRLLVLADPRTYSYARRASLRQILGSHGLDRMVACVYARNPAPYLVARCYLRYERGAWDATTPEREAERIGTGEVDPPLWALVTPPPTPIPTDRVDRIETGVELQGTLFVPRDGVAIDASLSPLSLDWAGVCYLPDGAAYSGTYAVFRGRPPAEAPPSGQTRQACLTINDEVRKLLPAVTAQACAGASTPLQTAQAIEHYLQTTYTYGLGYAPPPGDPLKGFLIDHKPAHCELFATSMAMMLRHQGIPSRYITGFMVNERNDVGDYYVIREEHAHAWVEAWIPGLGWTSFDPTPPDGRPTATASQRKNPWTDLIIHKLQQWRNRLLHIDWRAALNSVLRGFQRLGTWLIEKPWRLLVLLGLLALDQMRRNGWRGPWLRRWSPSATPGEGPVDPLIGRLTAAMARFDTTMARAGRPRSPSQTLREYAVALQEEAASLDAQERETASAFLERYSRTRYGAAHPDEPDVRALETLCDTLETLATAARSSR